MKEDLNCAGNAKVTEIKKRSFLYRPSWLVGIIVAVVVATSLTLFITVWEWIENPGGIFRGEDGTQWNFVFDTAISWFIPTLIPTFLTASIAHLVLSKIGVIPNQNKGATQRE